MIGLWTALRPHALIVALGVAAALAAWRWAVAVERQQAAEEEARRLADERDHDRQHHAAELGRLEQVHRELLEHQRQAGYRTAARREAETLQQSPTEAGAEASSARRAAYRGLLGEGTHDR